MVLFQGADVFFWFWVVIGFTILTVAMTWYWAIVGRDSPPRKQRRGETTVERYGPLEEDRAPLPKFLIWTFVIVIAWVIGYVIWTGINGMGV